MSKKITLIIDNIITPYEIARYNAINTVLEGNLLVWFQAESDLNRHWHDMPKIEFQYKVLKDKPLRLIGKDIHTFHINPNFLDEIKSVEDSLKEVIICGWDSATYWQTVYFCKQHPIPYRLWSGSTANENSWRRILFYPIINWVVAGADSYIAYGSRAKNFLISLGAKPEKIEIFLNSIDVHFFSAAANKLRKQRNSLRSTIGIKKSDFIFLYVGQLIERKGIKDLRESIKELGNNVKLLVIGEGPLKSSLEDLSEKVVVVGHVEYNELPKYYVLADCLVLPSREEVWGLVINEAIACGLPVVASDAVGATEDLVVPGKTGYTYRSGDTASLTSTLKKIMSSNFGFQEIQDTARGTDPEIFARKLFK